jgi:hypothetical protein
MLKVGSSEGIIESRWDNPFYNYGYLREKGLAGEMDNDGFFLFPLQSRLSAHEGAIWQTAVRTYELAEKVGLLETENQELRALVAGRG